MSKNTSNNKTQEDYCKSISKITILGLTTMATLGTSMLVMECNKASASMLLKSKSLLKFPTILNKQTILKSQAFKPIKPNTPNIPLLNRSISKSPTIRKSTLPSLKKHQTPSIKNFSEKRLPITTPTGKNSFLKTKK